METFLLAVLGSFRWLIRKTGADYDLVRAIVAVKLKTDNRRQPIAYRSKVKEGNNTFILTIVFYGLLGIVVAFAISVIPSFILSMILVFGYIMMMVAMSLITDFSSVLLDTSDNTIILPRPVDGRTLFIARISHILLYLGQLALALTLVPVIIVYMEYGGAAMFIFLVLVVLSILSAVLITNAFYLLILQFSSEEKLKNIINYFQILMAIVVMGGYQLIPGMMSRMNVRNYVFEVHWWHYFLPPVWMAGAMESVVYGKYDLQHIGLALCSVVVPILGIFMVNRYLAPIFSRKISIMSASVQRAVKRKERLDTWLNFLSTWATRPGPERGAFLLIYKILGRDRKLKLKIYPAFGYITIFGIIFIFRGQEVFGETGNHLHETRYYFGLLYLTFMILQVAFYEIPHSDDFKASWIYYSSPIGKPGEVLSGSIKAIFARLFLPSYAVVGVFVLILWGTTSVLDIVIAALNNFLMLIILGAIDTPKLPLSMAADLRNQSGNVVRGFVTVLLIGILGAGHYLLSFSNFLLAGVIPLQIGMIYFLQRSYRRIGWEDITP